MIWSKLNLSNQLNSKFQWNKYKNNRKSKSKFTWQMSLDDKKLNDCNHADKYDLNDWDPE